MKYLIILTIFLFSLTLRGQDIAAQFDGHKWEAPYNLSMPKDWGIERFLIPINFAPQISYKGVEDIRFTPGWGKLESDLYWTYAFLWYLGGSPKMDAAVIAGNLKAYYTGLIKINTDSTRITTEKWIPVTTSFKKKSTDAGDLETYTGTIEMVDYMQQKPITLNCRVHLKTCPEVNKTIIFYVLSPKPFNHANWSDLNQLWLDFKCKKS